jgi:hypothetical protein
MQQAHDATRVLATLVALLKIISQKLVEMRRYT